MIEKNWSPQTKLGDTAVKGNGKGMLCGSLRGHLQPPGRSTGSNGGHQCSSMTAICCLNRSSSAGFLQNGIQESTSIHAVEHLLLPAAPPA